MADQQPGHHVLPATISGEALFYSVIVSIRLGHRAQQAFPAPVSVGSRTATGALAGLTAGLAQLAAHDTCHSTDVARNPCDGNSLRHKPKEEVEPGDAFKVHVAVAGRPAIHLFAPAGHHGSAGRPADSSKKMPTTSARRFFSFLGTPATSIWSRSSPVPFFMVARLPTGATCMNWFGHRRPLRAGQCRRRALLAAQAGLPHDRRERLSPAHPCRRSWLTEAAAAPGVVSCLSFEAGGFAGDPGGWSGSCPGGWRGSGAWLLHRFWRDEGEPTVAGLTKRYAAGCSWCCSVAAGFPTPSAPSLPTGSECMFIGCKYLDAGRGFEPLTFRL